ncbi:MAG: type II toxin-antitoxin system HicA family toxin [Candidatus Aminicenantes bacterium]|nr:type II toxin-antitoxin system HicA family toxin [Candidatus Aminicenantes bacterium]
MKIPRDIGGRELARLLGLFGYFVSRQTGSHIRLTKKGESDHHVTIPDHRCLRVGTLNNIIKDIAAHLGKTREEVIEAILGE